MQMPGWANVTMFSQQGITGFEALDEHRLQVSLNFLDSGALLSLAYDHSKIVAREVVERYGNLKDSPVIGTGAWIWEDTIQGVGNYPERKPNLLRGRLTVPGPTEH